ncbi:MAG TPA: M20 family peptidase [Ideonella sp.]|uniref:M20 family peptidase n=1 Tax=Ideonella sp. TaxID=1929293 RepID=UPI002E35AF64|nr:M20 family peptidase [Ideonella sp.]HEX5684786.1 M20 family peptidase [Ideonella sp.]
MLRRLLLTILAVLGLLVAAVAVNTLRQGSRQLDVPPAPPLVVDEAGAATRLAEAIRARTISSYDDAALNTDQFEQLHTMLQARYPKAHAVMQRELVGGLSLLYTWKGSDPKLQPILLMAHQDVVPVSPGTERDWVEQPFAGTVKDGFVWGRGAWDDKGNLIAQMETMELLASSGFQPKRTIHLAFGADEEVSGERGAKQIAALLKSRGERLDFVIDEGLLITEGIMPGLSKPAALIGIAEKGYLSVVLKVPATPGHSSMPPPKGESAIAMMSAALKRLDDKQLPGGIRGVAREMFETVAPEMSGFGRIALSNLWLFGPVVQKQLEAKASTNAMLRTTTALTMTSAGNKENVLPGRAEATVNFRLLPGDSASAVMGHVHDVAEATMPGGRYELSALPNASEASRVSPTQSASYQLINKTVREVFPGTLVAPGLMIGATDSRHFEAISDHIYRFSPVRAKPEDLARFHGTNERISAANLAELIRFYHRLVSQAAGAGA